MYKQADVVIFCFSLAELKVHLKKKAGARKNSHDSNRSSGEQAATSSTISLASVRYKWVKEVLECLPSQESDTVPDAEPAATQSNSNPDSASAPPKEGSADPSKPAPGSAEGGQGQPSEAEPVKKVAKKRAP